MSRAISYLADVQILQGEIKKMVERYYWQLLKRISMSETIRTRLSQSIVWKLKKSQVKSYEATTRADNNKHAWVEDDYS